MKPFEVDDIVLYEGQRAKILKIEEHHHTDYEGAEPQEMYHTQYDLEMLDTADGFFGNEIFIAVDACLEYESLQKRYEKLKGLYE